MTFVQRNDSGKITGVYANPQLGYAEEELADDNEEVLAFLNPHPIVVSISRRQFFQQAAIASIITEDEAVAAVMSGTLPAAITAFIASLPADQQFGAKMLFSVDNFERSSPMTNAFGQTIGMSLEQIDGFFTAASAL